MKHLILVLALFPIAGLCQSSSTAILDGKFIAPAGVTVVIQKDGKDDLTLVAKKDGSERYTTNAFKFPKAYTSGTPYTLTVKSCPPGFTCTIEKGQRGTVGLSPGFIRVGADYTYDLVSRSSDNGTFGTFYESQSPVLGGDFSEEGRYVAFMSSAAGLDNSSGKHRQIYWRDRKTGTTKMVTRGINGEEGNADSFFPSISADGKIVAFESYSTNLTPGNNNTLREVYSWSSLTNIPIMVSTSGVPPNAESFGASISADGSKIAFSSGASNLTAGVEGTSTINVYLKDISSGNIKLLSIDRAGKAVGGSSPSISADGSKVAFCSSASTLVADDKNGLWDIFVYDNSSPNLKRVSMGFGGAERMQGTESISREVAPSISGDGNYVSYATTAPNVVSRDTNGLQDVFVVNINTMTTVRVSVGSNGVQSNGDSPIGQGEKIDLSFDGSWATFTTNSTNLGVPAGNVLMCNVPTGKLTPITNEPNVMAGRPAMSRNGGYVAFGMGSRLDRRFSSSGLFARFTGLTRCLACVQ